MYLKSQKRKKFKQKRCSYTFERFRRLFAHFHNVCSSLLSNALHTNTKITLDEIQFLKGARLFEK